MRAIFIAAGRGRRLMPLTEDVPKCYAEIGGRRILDWCVAALRSAGLDDIVFVGGYRIERVRADYPGFRFCDNAAWESNNILSSLFCAEHEMADGFVSSYADILYTPAAVQRLLASPGDIALLVDTDWRRRYQPRTEHPETDGEKVRLRDGHVVEVNRAIPPAEAPAEFTGVAKFTPAGRPAPHRALSPGAPAARRSGPLPGSAHLREGVPDPSPPGHAGGRGRDARGGDARWLLRDRYHPGPWAPPKRGWSASA